MLKKMLRIFSMGWVVLILAIGANALAKGLGVLSWYEFLGRLGSDVLFQTRLIDALWLFGAYPLFLGVSALVSEWIAKKI